MARLYKICFFCPPSHTEIVKEAMFSSGAGKIGQYQRCSWQVLGTGQFEALKGAQPFLGQVGDLEMVEEYRVEMICEEAFLEATKKSMIDSHPYEAPAWEIYEIFAGAQ